jgi:agmatinase
MKNPIDFDPNAVARKDAGIFGLPYTVEEAKHVIIPVPWEVTVSYNSGTVDGPQAIFDASAQVDLFDLDVENAWKVGFAMDEMPNHLIELNDSQRAIAETYLDLLQAGETPDQNPEMKELLDTINAACELMVHWVQKRAAHFLDQGKIVSVIGGDHSTPLGLIRELAKRHSQFGILHFDAHSDLRDAYEGFTYSHASIMSRKKRFSSMIPGEESLRFTIARSRNTSMKA